MRRDRGNCGRNPTPLAILGVLLLLGSGGGCGTPITVRPLTPDEIAQVDALGNFPDEKYRIEAGDTLEIEYVYHPEMKQDEVVRSDGRITARLVGEIPVAGMIPADLAELLVTKTSDRLRNPEVSVRIGRFGDKAVYVGGEVGKPGLVPYQRGLTPLQAIIAAGGFRASAQPDSVILVRAGRLRNGFVSRKLNLAEVITAGTREPLRLAPHDVLYVPRSGIAEADLWVRQHITDLIPFFGVRAVPIP